MQLPVWQTPLLRAFSHYGGYIGDTNGKGNPPQTVNISRFESGEGYRLAGLSNPLYAWLENQGVKCTAGSSSGGSKCRYFLNVFAGIPSVSGPNCSNSTCGLIDHVHVADPCVARGLAGLAGGC
jgi:hypothetical protein